MTDVAAPRPRPLLRAAGFLVGLAAVGAAGLFMLYGSQGRVSTDNAYVKLDKLNLAAEVSGVIAEVAVRANQPVRRGDLLVRLDDAPYRLAVEEAEAELARARNELEARRAEFAEAEAALARAERDAAFFARELARSEQLSSIAVSESQLDERRQALERARADIRINQQRLSRLRAELGGDPSLPLEAQAVMRAAQARLEQARYQLARTRLVAPVDGVVANEVPQPGEMAPAGLTLVSMLGTDHVWLEANLKETQLGAVREGQPATVHVDAYPEHVFEAEVESLSPASGSEFALIPAQNASGNWVKVVQRVPVRLRLVSGADAPVLRAGMSAEVTIDTRGGSAAPAAGALAATRP